MNVIRQNSEESNGGIRLDVDTELRFLPARRYVSAGITYGPVSLSVTCRYCIETAVCIELVFGILTFLDLSYNAF